MERQHDEYLYTTQVVQDYKDGFGALDLYRRKSGNPEVVGRIIYWDALGQFYVEPTMAEIPLVIFEEFLVEAKTRINGQISESA